MHQDATSKYSHFLGNLSCVPQFVTFAVNMLLWVTQALQLGHVIAQLHTPTQWASNTWRVIVRFDTSYRRFMQSVGKRLVSVVRFGGLFCFHLTEVMKLTNYCYSSGKSLRAFLSFMCFPKPNYCFSQECSCEEGTKCKQSQLKRNPKQSSCNDGKHPESLLQKSSLVCCNSRLGRGGRHDVLDSSIRYANTAFVTTWEGAGHPLQGRVLQAAGKMCSDIKDAEQIV